MRNDFTNSIASSLNSPYRAFCEEYIRLSELIIQFEQDQIEIIEKAEKDELTMLYMGQNTKMSFLGEDGIKKHFQIVKARVIKESIAKNSGVSQVYNMLNKFLKSHSVERSKLGLTIKNGSTLMPHELIENYEVANNILANFKVQDGIYQKK